MFIQMNTQAINTMKRVLFLHATWNHTSEYNVHVLLAQNADPHKITNFFIWQKQASGQGLHSQLENCFGKNRFFHWDFGRDMSITPKPSKHRRAMMMASRLPASLYFLRGKIESIKPDFIYTSQQHFEVTLARWLSAWYKIPHIIHISYPVGPWLGKGTFDAIRSHSYLIACSDYVRETAVASGVSENNIITLHHGANLEQYNIPKNGAALRQEFGWAADTTVITAAARLDPKKGYLKLLEAFSRVHEQAPHARLLICGTPTTGTGYDQVIKQKANSLNLGDSIVFAGYRTDLPFILSGTDIFCLPTENDALPLVFLAAMAAGLPTVGSLSGGVPEMVIDQETGLLSEVGDIEALTNDLLKLVQDKQLATEMGRKGQERALTQFNPKAVADHWTEILYDKF